MKRSTQGMIGAAIVKTLVASAGGGVPSPQLSEIRIDDPRVEFFEYFEVAGDAGLSLDGLTYVVIGDGEGDGGSGVIEAVISLDGAAITEFGFYSVGEINMNIGRIHAHASLNFEDGDNVTHLLVAGFNGSDGQDLDTNDDGALDTTPWTNVLDAVGLIVESNPPGTTEFAYGGSLGFVDVGPDSAGVPNHVYRGSDCGAWQIGTVELSLEDTAGQQNFPCPPAIPHAFGLAHQALGDVKLIFNQSSVEIGGIGSTGSDGVSIALGAAEGWRGDVDFGQAGKLAIGSRVVVQSAFELDLVPLPHHVQLTIDEVDGGDAAIALDAAVCNPCNITVDALLDGVVVDSVTHQGMLPEELARGAIGSSGDDLVSLRYSLTTVDVKSGADFSMLLRNAIESPMTLAGSASGAVIADALRISLNGLPPGVPVNHNVSITAASLPALTLADEALVQFHAEHRVTVPDVSLLGAIDDRGQHDLIVANIHPSGGGASICCPGDLDGNGIADAIQGLDLRLIFMSDDLGYLAGFQRTDSVLHEDSSIDVIGDSAFQITASGNWAFYVLDPPSTMKPVKIVTVRLDGVDVAQGLPPGNSMFVLDQLSQLPETWQFELLESAEDSQYSFRIVWRWDEPTAVTLIGGGGGIADEVEVLVTAATTAAGQPVELAETELFGGPIFLPAGFIIDDAQFIIDAACPADISADDSVGPADLAQLLAEWGQCRPGAKCRADIAPPPPKGGDGVVDPGDLAQLLASWGPCN